MISSPSIEEKQLLERLSKDDEAAFRVIFDRYRGRLYFFAWSITQSEMVAEEIVQDIFLKLWTQRKELTELNSLNAWLQILTRNHAYNYLKRLSNEKIILKELAETRDHSSGTNNDIQWREYQRILRHAIDDLPARQKEVYIMSRAEDMSYAEIAEQLGISVNTVKFHMKEALSFIKSRVKMDF